MRFAAQARSPDTMPTFKRPTNQALLLFFPLLHRFSNLCKLLGRLQHFLFTWIVWKILVYLWRQHGRSPNLMSNHRFNLLAAPIWQKKSSLLLFTLSILQAQGLVATLQRLTDTEDQVQKRVSLFLHICRVKSSPVAVTLAGIVHVDRKFVATVS